MTHQNMTIGLLAAVLGACAGEPQTGTESSAIVDKFEQGGSSLEIVALPADDGSYDVQLTWATDVASHSATFNVADADLGTNQELAAVMSQLDAGFLLHIQENLAARETPRDPVAAIWLAIERGMFGYVHLGDQADAAYASCFFGTGTWEYCPSSGLEHCCVFDHGCSWLCSAFGWMY